MTDFEIAIFIAQPAIAEVTGRYICLIRGESGGPDIFHSDSSLVDLANQLGDRVTEWYMVEEALNKTGIWYH